MLPISIPRFKSNIFYCHTPKIKLFLQKKAKFSSAWAPPPDPRASGGWGLCPQAPPASGSWGLRPQTPIALRRLGAPVPDQKHTAPHCEFLATRLLVFIILNFFEFLGPPPFENPAYATSRSKQVSSANSCTVELCNLKCKSLIYTRFA